MPVVNLKKIGHLPLSKHIDEELLFRPEGRAKAVSPRRTNRPAGVSACEALEPCESLFASLFLCSLYYRC